MRQRIVQARARRRQRQVLLALLAVLLLSLLLLLDCRCTREPPPEPAPEPVMPVPAEEPEATLPRHPPIQRMDRPEYTSEVPEPLAWLDSFRMQVAARSPRLAECFVGAERPGRLKWTASVDPLEGKVSEHQLEPVLTTDALTATQRACAVDVLSEPSYTLVGEGRATPSRLSMIIEF